MITTRAVAAIIRDTYSGSINSAFSTFEKENWKYLVYPRLASHVEDMIYDHGVDPATIDEYRFIRYELEPQKSLLQAVRSHAAAFQGEFFRKRKTVFLVHPLAPLFLKPALKDKISAEQEKGYLRNIKELLRMGLNQEANVFLLDTINGYAAATSKLVEQRAFCRYVPTKHNRGSYLDITDIDDIVGSKVYIAGSFNRRCLQESILVSERKLGSDNVCAIADACMNSPEAQSMISEALWPPTEIYTGTLFNFPVKSDRIVNIGQLMEK